MSRKSTLAQNIKRLRKQLKLSQEELAKKAGITYSTLIKIESGVNKNPTLETLCKLAEAFKISLDELTGWEKRNKMKD
jgi:transcriptional regulator with XRE-family HTH domain